MDPTLPPALELTVRVVPNASRTEIASWQDDVLRVRLNAPPVDGKANKALISFLAAKLGLRPRDLDMLCGATARLKRLAIRPPRGDWRHRLDAS